LPSNLLIRNHIIPSSGSPVDSHVLYPFCSDVIHCLHSQRKDAMSSLSNQGAVGVITARHDQSRGSGGVNTLIADDDQDYRELYSDLPRSEGFRTFCAKDVEARRLEQLRSRLLALTTELESGSIVHRRAFRVSQLNHLRDQAVNELRSQAGLEGTPQTLPGPEADEWIEWACGLKEPEDAESLQTLRIGFAHLDDFVAHLEPKMWMAAGSPTLGNSAGTREICR
jgi:hypothetical protein